MKVFVDLYDKGLIYRDNYMVNWDPGTQLGDLGPRGRGPRGHRHALLHRLPARGRRRRVTVATVRPETMLADTAVAVNPEDERYRDLVGKTAILPLVGRRLPVIADEYVKPEFGTGALKITPGHDPNDFEIGRRHGLEEITVIGEDGRMTEAAGRFAGLTVDEAQRGGGRGARAGGPDRASRSPTRTRCRSRTAPGERIEPLISLQWFMRMDELAAPAIEAVRVGTHQLPSRALGAGLPRLAREHPALVHLAPAVVGAPAAGLVLRRLRGDLRRHAAAGALRHLRRRAAPRRRTCSTPGSPRRCGRSRRSAGRSDTPELRAFYPTDVLVTARDIIFLWVARMVMMGLEFPRDVPFEDVVHHVDHPGARRAPDVEVARHGHRPARRDRGARRGRGALRAAGDVVVAGRALLGREDPAGPAAREQDVERVAAGAAERRRRRAGAAAARPSRTAGSCRGCSARSSRIARADRGLRLLPRGARASTRSSTASSATGTWRW